MRQAITLLLLAGSAASLACAAFAGSAPGPAPAVGAETAIPEAPVAGLWRISGDGDEDEEGWVFLGSSERMSEGNEEGREDCDDDDEDDGGCAAGGAGNPAPAGSVAPPKNGLFTNGTVPQAKTN